MPAPWADFVPAQFKSNLHKLDSWEEGSDQPTVPQVAVCWGEREDTVYAVCRSSLQHGPFSPFHVLGFASMALHLHQAAKQQRNFVCFVVLASIVVEKDNFPHLWPFQSLTTVENAIMERWLLLVLKQEQLGWIPEWCRNSYKSPLGLHFWPWWYIQKTLSSCRLAHHYHWASQLISVSSPVTLFKIQTNLMKFQLNEYQ